MKMIRNNKVYVQKRDLSLIFGKPFDISYYIDESLGLDFVEILDDRSKKMVLSSEFIINYDELCCESYEKIKIFRNMIDRKLVMISMQSQKVTERDTLEKMDFECKKLINMSNELLYLLMIKEKEIDVSLNFNK